MYRSDVDGAMNTISLPAISGRAAILSAAMLLEPVGATALAWVVLGEVPTPTAAAGVAVVVGGVVLATVDLSKR